MIVGGHSRYIISHIFRLGNHYANILVSHGLFLPNYTWLNNASLIIRHDLVINKLDLSNFRFSYIQINLA